MIASLLLAGLLVGLGVILRRRRARRWRPPIELARARVRTALARGATWIPVRVAASLSPGAGTEAAAADDAGAAGTADPAATELPLGTYWRPRWHSEGDQMVVYMTQTPALVDDDGRPVRLGCPASLVIDGVEGVRLVGGEAGRSDRARVVIRAGTRLHVLGLRPGGADPAGPFRAGQTREVGAVDGHFPACAGSGAPGEPAYPPARVAGARTSAAITALAAVVVLLSGPWMLAAFVTGVVVETAFHAWAMPGIVAARAEGTRRLGVPEQPAETHGLCPRCQAPCWVLSTPAHGVWVSFGQCSGGRQPARWSCGFTLEFVDVNAVFEPALIATEAAEAFAAFPVDGSDPRAAEIARLVTTDPPHPGKYTHGRTVVEAFEQAATALRRSPQQVAS